MFNQTLDNKKVLNGQKAKFLRNRLSAASPGELITMLYDGALQWINMASAELDKQNSTKPSNWSDYSYYVNMAIAVTQHLQDSLNFEASEEISDNFYALYDFIQSSLHNASLKKEKEHLETANKFIKELRSHWNEMLAKINE